MNRSLAVLFLTVAVSRPAQTLAQSYGSQDQTLTIGAVAFEVEKTAPSGGDVIGADGYLYGSTTLSTKWSAPLLLPNGALIEEFCVDYKDNGTGLFNALLTQQSLARDGETPSSHGLAFIVSTQVEGYQVACRTLNARFLSSADPDGDGTMNPVAYSIRAVAEGALGIGAVRIRWKRDVSLPPPTPTFADVPASDGAWQHIEALAASGITAGCGVANYCPDSKLTRRQMAVFLTKALGLHWEN